MCSDNFHMIITSLLRISVSTFAEFLLIKQGDFLLLPHPLCPNPATLLDFSTKIFYRGFCWAMYLDAITRYSMKEGILWESQLGKCSISGTKIILEFLVCWHLRKVSKMREYWTFSQLIEIQKCFAFCFNIFFLLFLLFLFLTYSTESTVMLQTLNSQLLEKIHFIYTRILNITFSFQNTQTVLPLNSRVI